MKRTKRPINEASLHAAQEFGRALTVMAEILHEHQHGTRPRHPGRAVIRHGGGGMGMFERMRGWSAVLAMGLLTLGALAVMRRRH